MTNEEAIERLKTDIYTYADFKENPNENEFWMAFDMAIKALEQQPCEDVISRDCDKCAYYVDGANDEACDGCFADEYEHPNFKPKAQPCEDAISREEALQALCKAVHKNDDIIPCSNQRVSCLWSKTKVQDYAEEILKLPSVTPKEKTGKWIVHPKGIYAHLVCNKCLSNAPYDCQTNYCPNCGARMVESQESEDKEVKMGLTDKHLAYGDDVPQTQVEKDYYWKIKHLEEKNDKLKEAVKKIINDIQGISENPDYKPIGTYDYVKGSEDCRKVVIEIIDKHLKGVADGDR